MSVERIKKTIIADAEKEAKNIIASAREEVDERLEKGRREIEDDAERRFEAEKKELSRDAERKVMQKRSGHNLELLRKRNEILQSVFERAERHLKEMDDESYRRMLGGWFSQIPEDVPGRLLCSNDDVRRVEPLVEEVNKDRGADAELALAGDDSVESGLVFKAEGFEVDLTVKTKLNELRETLTPEVARMVFPENVKI